MRRILDTSNNNHRPLSTNLAICEYALMTVSAPTCDPYRTVVDRQHESELDDSNLNSLHKSKLDTPSAEHMWSLYTFNHVTRKSAPHKQCAHDLSDVCEVHNTAHFQQNLGSRQRHLRLTNKGADVSA
jgi:hypothetical protein